jgi:hypothetical protein
MKVLPGDFEAYAELNANDCSAALKESTWRTDAELKQGYADAYRAVTMVGGEDADYLMQRYGNDPAFIRYAAKFGAGLREDSPPQAMQMIAPEEFADVTSTMRQQLMEMNINDPRRPALLAKLEALYTKQIGDKPAYTYG